jgi:Ca2+:H+ antiporter
VVTALLAAAVLAAVHHAEVVAHRVGEPYGSLVLAVAVTVIEVALIVTLMIAGAGAAETLARDTVFAAVILTSNGIVGLSILAGTRTGSTVLFNAEGAGASLATVATLATLSMVVPSFTTTSPGPVFSPPQLAFAAVTALALYGLFVVLQTGRHRDYFLPVTADGTIIEDQHATPPSASATWGSLALLFVALVGVVGNAKLVSPTIERGVIAAGLPISVVRRDHRDPDPRARDSRSVTRRAPRSHADQSQPRLRFGDGQHRADDPDDRGRLDMVDRSIASRARVRITSCCWP